MLTLGKTARSGEGEFWGNSLYFLLNVWKSKNTQKLRYKILLVGKSKTEN